MVEKSFEALIDYKCIKFIDMGSIVITLAILIYVYWKAQDDEHKRDMHNKRTDWSEYDKDK